MPGCTWSRTGNPRARDACRASGAASGCGPRGSARPSGPFREAFRVVQHGPVERVSVRAGIGIARPRRPHDELGNRPRANRMHPFFQVDEVAGEPAIASRPQKVGAGCHRHEARGDAVSRVVRVHARGE